MVYDSTNSNMKQVNILALIACAVIASAILIPAAGAFADDSIARFGAGGIEFLKSEDIRMLEEVLEISTKLIRVKFRFLNESDKDIHTTVAFPLPLYDSKSVREAEYPRLEKLLASFKVSVNGYPVKTTAARKAIVGNRDVADNLREAGLSDEQIFITFELAKSQEDALEKLSDQNGELLRWKVADTAFWQQTFPAGKEVVVEHSYEPAVGAMYMPYQKGFDHHESDWLMVELTGDTENVCLDDVTKRGIKNQIKTHVARDPEFVFVTLQDVEYILATGRNWKGPIGKFKLRIKKERPDQIVSLCFPGKPKKVSSTVYEFAQRNFVPPDKLVVYFYTVGPEVHN